MKQPAATTNYFFVDEAGDPTFYSRNGRCIVGEDRGSSSILILGFIQTADPATLRHRVLALRDQIVADVYFRGIPSLKKTSVAFHATDDVPEVRERFYRLIIGLDFTAEFIVARKIESIFRKRHRGKESVFYDDLVTKLFENKLHLAERSVIYFAKRGSRDRQEPLVDAIRDAITRFEQKWKTKIKTGVSIEPQSPAGEPCLQIIDYMNWAIQRMFIRREDRYFNFVREKVSLLVDVYDSKNYPRTYYTRKNPFELNKMSPL